MRMSLGMKLFSRRLFFSGAMLGILLLLPTVVGAEAPGYDLPQMRRVNPDFSTYPDARGIVWLKRVAYEPASAGGLLRTHLWVLLGRSGLDPRWLNWEIPEPPGGTTRMLEASVHAFDSGRKVADVAPIERVQGGVTMHSVRFGELPEPFVLVLSWQDELPSGLSLEDMVRTREDLPLWESVVEVVVPDGRPFFHRSLPDVRPEVRKDAGGSRYVWRALNTPSSLSGRLRAVSGGGVAFGMRHGAEAVARMMRNRASAAVPSAPPAALEGFRKGTEAGTSALLSWLYGQPEAVLPSEGLRDLPSEGPWTREEKLLLAHAWLRERGLSPLLHWRLPFEPDGDTPVSPGLLREAVLEIPPFKGSKFKESFFCDMEDAPRIGRTSPLLMGERVFRAAEDGRMASRKIPESKAAENRLRALLDLRLAPDGALSGRVRLQARGTWRSMLFRDEGAGEVRLRHPLSLLFPNIKGYRDLRFRESRGETELSFELGGMSGILGMQGKNLLAIPPAFVPEALTSLTDGPVPFDLAFPFLLEQRLTLLLPQGTAKVILSADSERASRKVHYSDSCKLTKLKKLTAEARIQVSATRMAEDDASALKAAVEFWRNFSTRPVPVQMRNGK